MKHFKSIIAAVVISLIINSSHAQEKVKLENSVLWKVEHPTLKKPSYILGTVHLMCEDDFDIPKKVTQAMDRVDALVLEVNMADEDEMKSMQETMANAEKISVELSKEQFNVLDSLVTRVMGASLLNFDQYGLTILNALMTQKMLNCSPTQLKSLETELSIIASTHKKPIYSLEKAAEQIKALKKAYPTAFSYQQILLFDSYKKDYNEAINAYKNEDITTAVELLTKDVYMDENATEHMQVKRNKNWAEKMPQMMKERSNLFALGAAHLTNEYGVIHLLREKGYTITPVLKEI